MRGTIEKERPATPTLRAARRLIQHADTSPRVMKRRIITALAILGIGLAFSVAVVLAVRFGVPQNDEAKALAMFLLLGSLMLSVAALLSLVLIAWSGYVAEYIRRLEQDVELCESTYLVDQVVGVSMDPEFDEGFAALLEEECRRKEPSVQIPPHLMASLYNEPTFIQKLSQLVRKVLVRRTNNVLAEELVGNIEPPR